MNNHKSEIQISTPIINTIAHDLSAVIGPLARVILAEKIYQLAPQTEVPAQRIPELIELSSLDIPDEKRRVEFIKIALRHYEEFMMTAPYSTIPGQTETVIEEHR